MKNLSALSAVIYVSLSLAAGGIFYLISLLREYTLVERLGGAGWVFFLSLIILMPVVIPFIKTSRGI